MLRMVSQYWNVGILVIISCLQASFVWPSSDFSVTILLQLSQRQSAHLVGMSCPSYVGCFEDGVGCAKECQIMRHRLRSVQWSILRPPSRPHYVLHIAIAIWSPPNMTCHRHVFEASSTEPYYINVCMSGRLRPMLKMM